MAGYVATFSYQAAVSHAPQFSPGRYRHFTVTPATGAIGAVIEGIDLANASDEAIGELERALIDHIALMIRGQDLEPGDQVNLARRLGTTESAVVRLEGGQASPSLATLRRYAEATGTRLTVELVPAER